MPTSTIVRKARAMTLRELASTLRDGVGLLQKKEIQAPAELLPWSVTGPWGSQVVRLGDDCAAIPDEQGHLLFAIEGISPELVASSPRAAGYCAVLVNASDIYSMGGRPLAVVDAVFSRGSAATQAITLGMQRAAAQLGIPIVGGHTNLHSPYDALAVSIVGRANKLITSFDARPGDDLLVAIDLRGKMHPGNPFWDATDAPGERMRDDYAVLPWLAEQELCGAGKDISMGGLVGTLLMLLESSGVGARIDLPRIPTARRHRLVTLAGRLPELWFRARDVARTLRAHSRRLCSAAHRLRTHRAGRCESTAAATR